MKAGSRSSICTMDHLRRNGHNVKDDLLYRLRSSGTPKLKTQVSFEELTRIIPDEKLREKDQASCC